MNNAEGRPWEEKSKKELPLCDDDAMGGVRACRSRVFLALTGPWAYKSLTV